MKPNKIIISILIVGLFIVIGVLYFIKGDLKKHHNTIQATITSCEWKSRGTARYVIEGIFKIEGKNYTTSCQLRCQDLQLSQLKEKLINLKVMAVYKPQNPIINYLLIEGNSYDLYDVQIPDSLKWVAELVRCK